MQPDDDQLVGGTVLRRPAIRSPNFVTGVSGWSINIDGSAEFQNATIRGSLVIGGTAPAAREVIGGTVPAELTTYYTTGVTGITPTAPETVVALIEQTFDGQGNYGYRAVVVDSSATKVTSIVYGATVSGVVTEAGRFVINPGALLGGGRYEQFTENDITIMTAPSTTTTVQSTRVPGNAFDIWSLNVAGTMGWGTGAALTDAFLSRIAVGNLQISNRLDLVQFGVATDTTLAVGLNGNGNQSWFVRANGQNRWSDGTNPSDTDLSRNAAGVLQTSGRFLVGGSTKDVAASCKANTAGLFAGSNTSTSTSYANLGSPASIASFVKQFTATAILVWMDVTVSAVTAAAAAKFGVQVNGVDYDVSLLNELLVGDNLQCSGVAIVAAGVAAGTYTIQGRFKRNGGTGTVTLGTNDWCSMAALEVSQ